MEDTGQIVEELYRTESRRIRPLFEPDDFGEAFTPEVREQEERLRARLT